MDIADNEIIARLDSLREGQTDNWTLLRDLQRGQRLIVKALRQMIQENRRSHRTSPEGAGRKQDHPSPQVAAPAPEAHPEGRRD